MALEKTMNTRNHLNTIILASLTLAGCATSSQDVSASSASLVVNPIGSASVLKTLPKFSDEELMKLPGVKASMDQCHELNKKHKAVIKQMESGPTKGALWVEIVCADMSDNSN